MKRIEIYQQRFNELNVRHNNKQQHRLLIRKGETR